MSIYCNCIAICNCDTSTTSARLDRKYIDSFASRHLAVLEVRRKHIRAEKLLVVDAKGSTAFQPRDDLRGCLLQQDVKLLREVCARLKHAAVWMRVDVFAQPSSVQLQDSSQSCGLTDALIMTLQCGNQCQSSSKIELTTTSVSLSDANTVLHRP